MPKVSVIVPIYNVEKYIEKCARSLCEQTLDDIELIFVNDCSTDKSIDILESVIKDYPNRAKQVQIIHQKVNGGSTMAREKGYEKSTGDYIIYCDADDWVDRDMYRKMYDTAIVRNADVVSCGFQRIFSENPSDNDCHQGVVWGADNTDNIRQFINYPLTALWFLLVKRSVYLKACNDDKEALTRTSKLGITYCEDFHLTMRLLANSTSQASIPDILYFYNQQNVNSLLHNQSQKSMRDEQIA